MCGFLASEETTNPLFSTLPRALKIDVRRGATREWIEASVRFAAGELAEGRLASSSVLTQLSESLLIEAVRQYSSTLHEEEHGWLRGLKDPRLGHALALIHQKVDAPRRRTLLPKRLRCRVAPSWSGSPRLSACRRFDTSRLAASDRDFELARDPQRIPRWRTPWVPMQEAFSRAFKREFRLSPGR